MENVTSQRKPLRDQLQRLTDEVLEILSKKDADATDARNLRINLELLQKAHSKLEELNEKMLQLMNDAGATADAITEEFREAEKWSKLYVGVRGDIEEFQLRHSAASTVAQSVSGAKKKKYHLPELKLKTFGGNLKDWLGWWSQFRQIHEDGDLRTCDKFLYLAQSMEQNSEAQRLVNSYPMMDENYEPAVDALRKRFGRPDLLLQVYLRELQSVVIANASGQKKLPLSEFYVSVVSHLRSLSALNLDKADPATWLYPLVESGLSEETLKAWQRSSLSKPEALTLTPLSSSCGEMKPKTRLDCLMEFILGEIESNQQITLAKQTFRDDKPKTPQQQPRTFPKWRGMQNIPTIAGLYAGQTLICGFCDKPHDPNHCYKAQKMSSEDRLQMIRQKRLCYNCCQSGHLRSQCLLSFKCKSCGGSHSTIVCTTQRNLKRFRRDESPQQSGKRRAVSSGEHGDLKIVTQNVNQCSETVVLNTLKVMLENDRGELKTVRLVGDSGSQRSFGATETLRDVPFRDAGAEYLQAVVFGGELTIPQRYQKKEVFIIGMNGVRHAVKLLEKRKLTGAIREIPGGPWIRQLQERGVTLTDVGDKWSEADILMGNDYWGSIRTGNIIHLACGLVAEETIFGWTIGGSVGRSSGGSVGRSSGGSFGRSSGGSVGRSSGGSVGRSSGGSVDGSVGGSVGRSIGGSVGRSIGGSSGGSVGGSSGGSVGRSIDGSVGRTKVTKWCGKTPTAVSPACFKSAPPQDIEKIWSLEALGIRDPTETRSLKEEEEEALKQFSETVKRDQEGRYVVALPWKLDRTVLPNNMKIAEQRLTTTTMKLKKTGKLYDYTAVFKSWNEEDMIRRVADDELPKHVIPHRPVFKESTTTPVRPVFDASCRQGRHHSLNDCLFKGPNLIELIPSMLLRFGAKKIGVTADIRKAFQMIRVREEDMKYQCFLWWKDDKCSEVEVFEHMRVVFGVTSSPFLLGATIQFHLQQYQNPTASLLRDSFYVDNLLTSVNTADEYSHLKAEATSIMNDAKMELRQWGSSYVANLPDSGELEEKMTILGVKWDRCQDELSCSIKNLIVGDVVTKRVMLSAVAQVFDPMGYVAPALLEPKRIIQETWSRKCGWDEEVPVEVARRFEKWLSNLSILENVKIPRYSKVDDASRVEVHICCDSSSEGMAAVAFLKTANEKKSKLQFLMCKSRLTPLKKLTIPRAELMSCVIAVRMARMIGEALAIPLEQFVFWGDSSTALAWIHRTGDWGVFVSNRVKEILLYTRPNQWRHVPGKQNPADLPSRGCSSRCLLESRWWEGPAWLTTNPIAFLETLPAVDETEVTAELRKKSTVSIMACTSGEIQPPRFSSYRKNVAIWGWVWRFVSNCRTQAKIKKPFLFISELRRGEMTLLKQVQRDVFPEKCSEVGGVAVEEDAEGILRVKTRLGNRPDKFDFLHPILLPKKHPLVDMLVNDAHHFYGHGGIQFLLGMLRRKYWILQTRRVVRRVVHECKQCQRHSVKPLEVDPAPLPKRRVEDCAVFSTTGVDLAGPLFLKDGRKVWIVIFTCAVYRAVYFDLVSGLTPEDFLGALERFISIHGRPNTLYSDNGTNFVASARILKMVDWEKVEQISSVKQIQWIFNPPTAAWWGGWWERLIRTVKDLLKRMLGKAKLTHDELRTCICGIAATMNDRPLTVVTEDSMDLIPLTPAMFMRPLQGGHLPELVDAEGLRDAFSRAKRLQRAAQNRFRREFLGLLVMGGGNRKGGTLSVGDVVLIGDDQRKRFDWPLGVVIELIVGPDEKSRLARVRTATRTMIRPLQRLYPLEVSSHAEAREMYQVSKRPTDSADEKKADGENPKMAEPVEKKKVQNGVEDAGVRTRSGRRVQKPTRYGQWCHIIN